MKKFGFWCKLLHRRRHYGAQFVFGYVQGCFKCEEI